jgi:hypothetical protein
VTAEVERVHVTQPSINPSNAMIDSSNPLADSTDDGCEDAFAHDLVIDQELDLPMDQGFLIRRKTEAFAKSRDSQFNLIQFARLFGRQLFALAYDDRITDHLHHGFRQFGIETLRVEFGQFANLGQFSTTESTKDKVKA